MIRLYRIDHHFERRSIHRPMVEWDWLDNGLWYICFSWGDGNTDPVWHIELQFTTGKYGTEES